MKLFSTLAILLTCFQAASAHDTWVELDNPRVQEDGLIKVSLKQGNDHDDFNVHGPLNAADACLTANMPCGCRIDIKPTMTKAYWSAEYKPTKPGLHVVSHLNTKQNDREREITSAKAYFVVGSNPTATKGPLMRCDRPLGHPLEIVPITNPVTQTVPNKPLRVRVLFEKQPLPNVRVTFIPEGATGKLTAQKTDMKGEAEFIPAEANLYLVVVHKKSGNSGPDYDSTAYTATLTVAVPAIPFPAVAKSSIQ